MSSPAQTDMAFLRSRREKLGLHPTQTGIDYITVEAVVEADNNQAKHYNMRLFFIPAAENITKTIVPQDLTTGHIRITGGQDVDIIGLRVDQVTYPENNDQSLIVNITETEDTHTGSCEFAFYTLHLIHVPNLDPFFNQVTFNLEIDEPGEFDPQLTFKPVPEKLPVPEINYLTKDFEGFRKLMLDRLSVLIPDWKEHHPADMTITLIETLAYAADQLSYFQDAVATEAYPGTARRRISVRRHARLIDYTMHEGCNARVWIQAEISDKVKSLLIDKNTQLMTRVQGQPLCIPPGSSTYNHVLSQHPVIFETLHLAELFPEHNRMSFYTWGADKFCLTKNSTQAALCGHLSHLKPGDVLVFEEVRGLKTGDPRDADPTHRHAVRLTEVSLAEDPIGKYINDASTDEAACITKISWDIRDRLPFPFVISKIIRGNRISDVSLACGNIILADHGRTIESEELWPAIVPEQKHYYPQLQRTNITHSALYNHERAGTHPAAEAIHQDPVEARPRVSLQSNGDIWQPQRDLFRCDRFAQKFVVEMESNGTAYLRFGDSVMGRRPSKGVHFLATYRIGNGTEGNIGSETISHLVTSEKNIIHVRNPLPARGGMNSESFEQVRLNAPQAFRTQERAVTENDYKMLAERHPGIKRASATIQWTGGWNTVFVTADRMNRQPLDDKFKSELVSYLEPFRLAGYELAVKAPQFVPLNIAMTIHLDPGQLASAVQQTLLEMFSNTDLPNGSRGFFHPENFTFGEPVYLSRIVAKIMAVTGIDWVDTDDTAPKPNRFQRWGKAPEGELKAGRISIGPLEIARLDNDPDMPENGMIQFYLEGGR